MKNKLSQSLLLCVIFFSCVQKKDNNLIEHVNLDSLMSNKSDRSFIQQVQYLPLETNENSMIARLDVMKKQGNKIFILDKTLSTVFIFNDKGDFVSKINKKGRGPGEYLYLKDFFVSNDKIHLLDCTGQFFIYDMNGHFINEIKLPFQANYCENLTDSIIVFQEININGKLE
ncbi:6-bladed beta-propeller protein [Breznakibacter xylanolyticus]|uniref:6-bladed beta-propeller protein n=1 Tax=Breznakibacter xylanolyticus TaxID=990 RepID=A0A2W7N0W3_9BACT|nr:6-bladed beta-propeller [Breznakibacter xylanolyticus]PZX13413.1 6-bladed beta-propeller protein [Breznakibacter xylanolyticus]